MKMTILERDDGITHIVLTGRLDTTGAEDIGEVFSEATAARKRPAIVDLSAIDFLASRGIGLLFANGKNLVKTGQKMVLLNPKGLVESVLETSKVDKVLPIAHSLNEALHILQGVPGQSVAAYPQDEREQDEARHEQSAPAAAAPVTRDGGLKLTIKNELSELADLNARLAHFLDAHGVPKRATYAVNLAIDELVVNVIRYAFVDDETHFIDIELAVEGRQVILRIEDEGRPFDPRRGPALDLHAEDREVGGLGLILVLDMVDVLNYRRVEEKNCVEVRVHMVADDEQDSL